MENYESKLFKAGFPLKRGSAMDGSMQGWLKPSLEELIEACKELLSKKEMYFSLIGGWRYGQNSFPWRACGTHKITGVILKEGESDDAIAATANLWLSLQDKK